MVKVNAPAMSLDASGSLAGVLVFSKWKGRNYVRKLVRPANPKAVKQISVRAMFKFLSQSWQNLSAIKQATWVDLAAQGTVSPFNAYMGAGQLRWRNFLAPSALLPVDETEGTANFVNEDATAGAKMITVSGDIDGVGGHWGVMIFRQMTTPVVPSFSNLHAILETPMHQKYKFIDTPLDPGHYYYNFRVFSFLAGFGANETEVDATVT